MSRAVWVPLLLALAACSPSRGIEAALVLADIAAGAKDSRLKRTTPEPVREPVRYAVDDRDRQGDLYRPGEPALAALVLVPGAARAGKDDPRLVAFARTLARARFVVLVPEIENLRALQVEPADAIAVADAVRHFASPSIAGGPVGIVAISYAAGPAILAALDPVAGPNVRFVAAVGGYYDIEAVVTFFTTGHYRDRGAGPWLHRTPNAYGKWVFAKGNAVRLDDPGDRALLDAIAERKMRDLGAEIDDLTARLGTEGRAVVALLDNRDPEMSRELIAALPAKVRDTMERLDLKGRDLGALTARLILTHGRDDAIIPYTESRALAAAASERAVLFLADSLAHVDLGPTGVADGLVLWQAVYEILAERDAMKAPR
jgi:hypothetical protein